MTLEDAEKTARNVVAVQEKYGAEFPSELAAGVCAHALLAVLPVVRAADLWRRSGTNPCGEPGCRCTECQLWNAIDEMHAALGEETR